MDSAPLPEARVSVRELADQCVKCGLCLPHCPTYRVGRVEAESPRGRIALAAALASGRIAPQADAAAHASALRHLDQCLGCLSCEAVCPSQVRYGELLAQTRSAYAQPPSLAARLSRKPRLLRALAALGRASGARRWLPVVSGSSSHLSRIAAEIPARPARTRVRLKPPATAPRGRVGLFLGCVASAFDRDTHAAAVALLQALGYAVELAPGQGCCGALDLHRGDRPSALARAGETAQAFRARGIDTVLVSASGCFGPLRELVPRGLAVRDVNEFLAADAGFASLDFHPARLRAALHLPCTQVNVARSDGAVQALLRRIPELDLAVLPLQPRCCGAAGDYFLRHPAIAGPLRAEKLDQVAALVPDLLLTSNIGCRIWLDNGLRQRASAVSVLHPLTLLARQLDAPAA